MPVLELDDAARARLAGLGLKDDPFAPDPLKIDVYSDDELPSIVLVDGFRSLERIDERLRSALASPKPRTPFFIVRGKSGTGRSAAAKFILNSYLREWRRLRETPDACLFVPQLSEDDRHFNIFEMMKSWMSALRVKPLKASLPINSDVNREMQNTILQSDRQTYIADYGERALAFARELQGHDAAFAVCFEDVVDQKLVGPVKAIFDEVRTLCVITTNGDVVAENGWTEIELTSLTGQQISDFIWRYWAQHTDQALSLFDRQVVDSAFEKRSHPVRKVRTLMSAVLRHKLVLAPNENWNLKQFEGALTLAEADKSPEQP